MVAQQPPAPPAIRRCLETALYAEDLEQAERFYTDVMGMRVCVRGENRHVFFALDNQVLLIFNPDQSSIGPSPGVRLPVPAHGARGPGHVCFAVSGEALDEWIAHLHRHGVAIEADFEWPGGGRSVYFRDPVGNSLELAEPKLWGFSE